MIFVVLFFLSVAISPAWPGSTITDAYGNTAYTNGTVSWAGIPAGTPYKTTTTYSDDGLKILFAFARSFINTVQPNDFPFGEFLPVSQNSTFFKKRRKEIYNKSLTYHSFTKR